VRTFGFSAVVLALFGCATSQPHSMSPSYGAAMSDVGRRFEVLGRALVGGRFELAQYELGEIEESFTGTLPHAQLPREGHPEVLPALVQTFSQAAIPDLRQALSTRNAAQSASAFGRMGKTCNECHLASGHVFIEVPLVPGHAVPVTAP
jgi:hypothetical protein